MNELFLIAHKVRGEPAFDVATKIECPECPEGTDEGFCAECDNTGFWWIIPTSGHRAYPYAVDQIMFDAGPMPIDLPDHYPTRAEPQRSLIDLLGIKAKPQAPSAPIKRRF